MPRTYTKTSGMYTQASLDLAIEAVLGGRSVRKVAQEFRIPHPTLQKKVKAVREGTLKRDDGRGKKTMLGSEVENNIVVAIRMMEKMGMGLSLKELIVIVTAYIHQQNIPNNFVQGRPGKEWTRTFLKRHKLTLKKGGLIQLVRATVTADPFVIYGFYETLMELVTQLELADKPGSIYNCDESGFPMDPTKTKTIGTIGQPTNRLTHGANRENITVLATASADGTAMPPLIIFQGKYRQSTWCDAPDKVIPGTQYAVSDNGWITADIFHSWFVSFADATRETRPLLLMFDGHMSHTSIETVLLAKREGISLLKLPAHCTDLLQPLDVGGFSPLKTYYEQALYEESHATGFQTSIGKKGFCEVLSSVWAKGLSPENIKSGFRATGTFPVDKTKYNVSRLDTLKMVTYREWVDMGKPLKEDGSPDLPEQEADLAQELSSDEENNAGPSQLRNQPTVPSTPIAATANHASGSGPSIHPTPPTRSLAPMTPVNLFTSPTLQSPPPSSIPSLSALPAGYLACVKLSNEQLGAEHVAFIKDNHEAIAYQLPLSTLYSTLTMSLRPGIKATLQQVDPQLALAEVIRARGRSETKDPPSKRRRLGSSNAVIMTSEQCIEEMENKKRREDELAAAKARRAAERLVKKAAGPTSGKGKKTAGQPVKKTTTASDKKRSQIDETSDSDDLNSTIHSSDEDVAKELKEMQKGGDSEEDLDLDDDLEDITSARAPPAQSIIVSPAPPAAPAPLTKTPTPPMDEDTQIASPAIILPPKKLVVVSDDDVGSYFAALYTQPRGYWWGKALRVFSDDPESENNQVELQFLKKAAISSYPDQMTWKEAAKAPEITIVSVELLLMGPVTPEILKGGTFRFPDAQATKMFDELDRLSKN